MARGKKDKLGTAEKTADFLAALIEHGGNISVACQESGLDRHMVYRMECDSEEFKAVFREAQRHGLEVLEDEARRRAFAGTLKPVYHKGEICGEIREYSDTLMIFLLKGGMPEKYRENSKVELSGRDGAPIEVEHSASPTIEDFIKRLKGGV